MAKAKLKRIKLQPRQLRDLVSVGPATLHNFERLGIRNVAELACAHADALYEGLCRLEGRGQDICCFDVFSAAVAQARNPQLPAAQCQWWYWSRKRKASEHGKRPGSRKSA